MTIFPFTNYLSIIKSVYWKKFVPKQHLWYPVVSKLGKTKKFIKKLDVVEEESYGFWYMSMLPNKKL